MTDLEFLRGVRKRLATHGWRKFTMGGSAGPNCLLGAAYEVTARGDSMFSIGSRLRQYVCGFGTAIGAWNDARTEAEVFAALDDAIARLEEMESGSTPEVTPEPVLA